MHLLQHYLHLTFLAHPIMEIFLFLKLSYFIMKSFYVSEEYNFCKNTLNEAIFQIFFFEGLIES
jgi:hypothetical protein